MVLPTESKAKQSKESKKIQNLRSSFPVFSNLILTHFGIMRLTFFKSSLTILLILHTV